jgi:multidrug efflux pump
MIYMESTSQANGTGSITISFETGTNPDLAQVDVQNRLSRATPRLPPAVTQQGVRVDKARSNFLLFTILSSDDPNTGPDRAGRLRLAQRAARDPAHQGRGPGPAVRYRARHAHLDRSGQAGRLQPVAGRRQQRDPHQNAQVASGTIGDLPLAKGQQITATVVVTGQLSTVEQFGNIVLRANPDGSTVRLKDVARIEIGGQAYATTARLNGKPSAGIGVQLSPSGNALETART